MTYGELFYQYNKSLEITSIKIPYDFLKSKSIEPVIRSKMVDWMVEVFSIFV